MGIPTRKLRHLLGLQKPGSIFQIYPEGLIMPAWCLLSLVL